MFQKRVVIVLVAVLISLLANVFFGRWLSAKISTLPVLNRVKILSPQAPIVINNQQVVRTSDSTDQIQAENSVKSKLSAVAWVDGNNKMTFAGSAVNLTSDGLFVTGAGTFTATGQKYYVILSDGTTAAITSTTPDSTLGLIFFKAGTVSISPVDLGNSGDLLPGEKLLFVQNSLQSYMPRFAAGFVSQAQADSFGLVFDSDQPSRAFGVEGDSQLVFGQAAVNLSGQVVGVWNGHNFISSDVLNNDISLYLNNSQNIIHPIFGFTYSMISKTQSALSNSPQGAEVLNVKNKTAGGLQQSDVIVSVDGNALSESNQLEPLLERYKTGDMAKFVVIRNGQQVNVSIKVQ